MFALHGQALAWNWRKHPACPLTAEDSKLQAENGSIALTGWARAGHGIESEAGVCKNGESSSRFCHLHCSLHS